MENFPTKRLILTTIPERFAICQLDPGAEIPEWGTRGDYFSITRTPEELSIICLEENVPEKQGGQRGWRAIKIEGPFNFNEIGVLNSITSPLALAQISLLAIATFDTDYIFVKQSQFAAAISILNGAGHQVS